jgi:hypothetical protein
MYQRDATQGPSTQACNLCWPMGATMCAQLNCLLSLSSLTLAALQLPNPQTASHTPMTAVSLLVSCLFHQLHLIRLSLPSSPASPDTLLLRWAVGLCLQEFMHKAAQRWQKSRTILLVPTVPR